GEAASALSRLRSPSSARLTSSAAWRANVRPSRSTSACFSAKAVRYCSPKNSTAGSARLSANKPSAVRSGHGLRQNDRARRSGAGGSIAEELGTVNWAPSDPPPFPPCDCSDGARRLAAPPPWEMESESTYARAWAQLRHHGTAGTKSSRATGTKRAHGCWYHPARANARGRGVSAQLSNPVGTLLFSLVSFMPAASAIVSSSA